MERMLREQSVVAPSGRGPSVGRYVNSLVKNLGHYGWKVLAVATLCHYFAWASTIIHSFGLFVIPISEDTGGSRGEILYAQSMSRITVPERATRSVRSWVWSFAAIGPRS